MEISHRIYAPHGVPLSQKMRLVVGHKIRTTTVMTSSWVSHNLPLNELFVDLQKYPKIAASFSTVNFIMFRSLKMTTI